MVGPSVEGRHAATRIWSPATIAASAIGRSTRKVGNPIWRPTCSAMPPTLEQVHSTWVRALALQGGDRAFDAGGDGVDREGVERLAQQDLAHAMHPADILRRQLGQQPVEPRAVRFGGVQQAQHPPGHSAALLKKMRVLS